MTTSGACPKAGRTDSADAYVSVTPMAAQEPQPHRRVRGRRVGVRSRVLPAGATRRGLAPGPF